MSLTDAERHFKIGRFAHRLRPEEASMPEETSQAELPDSQKSKAGLGGIPIPQGTFDLDLKVNDGYQSFSQELLRLSLLAIGGVSTVWLKVFIPEHQGLDVNGRWLIAAFVILLVAALCSLMHRYIAADSLSYQLEALRLRMRAAQSNEAPISDEERAEEKRRIKSLPFQLLNLLRHAFVVRKSGKPKKPDLVRAEEEEAVRNLLFGLATVMLTASILCLVLGVLFLGFAIFPLMNDGARAEKPQAIQISRPYIR